MPSAPEVTIVSSTFRSARFDTSSMRRRRFPRLVLADHHAAGPRALAQGAGRSVAVDDELHARRMRRRRPHHAPDDARRCNDRHVLLHAVGGSAIDGDRLHPRIRVSGNHLRGKRRRRYGAAQVQQLLQLRRPRRQGALLLQANLELRDLLPQRFVLRPNAAQVHVVPPPIAHAVHDARGALLNAGERAERDRLQDPHARFRLHLCRDQDHVANRDRQEQVPGALANIKHLVRGSLLGLAARARARLASVRPVSEPRTPNPEPDSVNRNLPQQIEVRQHLAGAEHDR